MGRGGAHHCVLLIARSRDHLLSPGFWPLPKDCRMVLEEQYTAAGISALRFLTFSLLSSMASQKTLFPEISGFHSHRRRKLEQRRPEILIIVELKY